jgi:hypothetical protein
MKVAVIFKGGQKNALGAPPDQKLMGEVGKYLADLRRRGMMLDGFGLKPPPPATESEQVLLDGPFAETKEVIGGIWIWQVDSIAQAWELLAKAPRPENLNAEQHGVVEIREIYEEADYGEKFVEGMKGK